MKKILAFVCLNYCFVVLAVSVSAQDFTPVADGVEYTKLTRQMKSADGKSENVVFNLLRLDLTKVRLDVVHAMDAAIGLEKTSSIAARYGANAAINAGFFRIDRSIFEGDDVSALMIDGKLLSEPINNRTALLIKNGASKTQVDIEKLDTTFELFPKKITSKLSGINRERKNDELILYTPEFHLTTLTGNGGTEFVVINDKIVRIIDGKGSNLIPQNGAIYSASGKIKEELNFLKIGDKFTATLKLQYPRENSSTVNNFKLLSAEDIVSGVPQLIKNGKIEITWEQEKSSKAFVETHHPRTAVAKLKDGKFLMVTVDGRSEASGGISLPDLAAFLLEIGAIDAMNLDGGGSTTMFLNGKIVNQPSDKEGERKVSDAILVTPRKRAVK